METLKQVAIIGTKKNFIDYCFDNNLKRDISSDTAIKDNIRYILVNTPEKAYGRRFDDGIVLCCDMDEVVETVNRHLNWFEIRGE